MPAWSALAQSIFPSLCPACGQAAVALCPACVAGLSPAPPAPPPPGVDWWVSPFAYQGAARRLIVAAKYRRLRTGLGWLGEQVAAAVRVAGDPDVAFDVVTWVPASAARRRRRGFDQAEMLARRVAADLGLPARRLLARRGGAVQTGSTRAERSAGPPLVALSRLDGRRVLLVDDVATTGGSLSRSAEALRGAGAGLVVAATGGRTPRGGFQGAG